ncbi:MAG: MFS transporter [Chlorobi bacterium]|nr:MFS transporter [Chlorobiota bacterium]
MPSFPKDIQYYKFSAYGFLKNLRFFDAFFILFLVDKGLPYSQIGLLYAIREITINIFELPSGIVADTLGRKTSLAASFITYIFSFLFFYYSSDFRLFLIAFILFGIADAFRSGTHKGMIMDYLKVKKLTDYKIEYYGHTRSWSQTGSAISSLIAGTIVFFSANYDSVFLYSVVPYLINLLLIVSYPSFLNYSDKNKTSGTSGLTKTFRTFLNTIKQPRLLGIINTSAIHSAYLKAVKDYIQPVMVNAAMMIPVFLYLEEDKRNGIFIGLVYFVIYLLTSKASRLSAALTKKHRQRITTITLFAGFSSGIFTGIFYYNKLWIPALITFTGIYIAENIRKPALTGFVADNTPNEILTSVMSAQSLLKTIQTALLAMSFGFVAQYFSVGTALFSVSVLLTILTFIVNKISLTTGKR